MNGWLSRGNLILGVSWSLAITMFVARSGQTNGQAVGHNPHAPHATAAAPQQVEAPARVIEAPTSDVPVTTDRGDALSRNDQVVPLPLP